MKVKYSLLCFLLLTIAVTILVAPARAVVQSKYLSYTTLVSSSESKHSFQALQAGSANSQTPASQSKGPQLRQAPDAAMHASVVPSTPGLFCLLIVLHLWINPEFKLVTSPTQQSPLQRILFRVIISPNAP